MIYLDTETELFGPGNQAPRPVCLQVTSPDEDWAAEFGLRLDDLFLMQGGGVIIISVASPQFWDLVEFLLTRYQICGQTIAYDLMVLMQHGPGSLTEVIFDAYRDRRVFDVGTAERMIWIATGQRLPSCLESIALFALNRLASYNGVPEPDKTDEWRLRYSELADLPIAKWPEAAILYAAYDARVLPEIVARQLERARATRTNFGDLARQTTADFYRRLIGAHGLRTDPVPTAEYRRRIDALITESGEVLCRNGLAYRTKDGTLKKHNKVMRSWVTRIAPPGYEYTKVGASLAEDQLEILHHDVADAWIIVSKVTTRSDAVGEWEAALEQPAHSVWDMTENSRSRTAKPQTQNRIAKSEWAIDRECLAPSTTIPGVVLGYWIADHAGLELDTLGQILLETVGWSHLADARIAGQDIHSMVGAQILAITVEELERRRAAGDALAESSRQTGKGLNFTAAGGGGARTLARNAWIKYGSLLHPLVFRVGPGEYLSERDGVRILKRDDQWVVEKLGTGVVIAREPNLKRARFRACDWDRNVELWAENKRAWLRTWPEMKDYFRAAGSVANGDGRLICRYTDMVRGGCSYTDAANGPFSSLAAILTHEILGDLHRANRVRGVCDALYGGRLENFVHDEYVMALPIDRWICERMDAFEEIILSGTRRWLPRMNPAVSGEVARRWSKRARRVRYADGRLGVWEWDDLTDAVWRVGRGDEPADVPGGSDAEQVLLALGDRSLLDELDARLHALATGWNQGPRLETSIEVARQVTLDHGAGYVMIKK